MTDTARKSAVFLASGLLFGAGLALSGMVAPAKVTGFLDILGPWDPSLAATMAGALAVTALLYAWAFGHGRARPAPGRIDTRLILGAVLFGIGWGLAGICPGPGIAAVVLAPRALLFVLGMAAGVMAYDRIIARKR